MAGPVRFQWQAEDGQWYDVVRSTRDIGKVGVFIESDSLESGEWQLVPVSSSTAVQPKEMT